MASTIVRASRLVPTTLVVLSCACVATAQTIPAITPWDVSVQTGAFVNHPADDASINDNWDDWYSVATVGVSVGRYFSPHLKVEGEFMLSATGERYRYRHTPVPGVGPITIGTEERIKARSASGALVWQFRDNQWVHPFVFAGAAVETDSVQLHTLPQFSYRGDPRFPENQIQVVQEAFESFDKTLVRGLLGLGAKLYVSHRAYFRTDSRIAVGTHESGNVSFRLGFGVDF